MSSAANGRRSIAHRIREARRAYRGPFQSQHVQVVLFDAGYVPASDEEDDAFLVFVKDGCKPIPVNPIWDAIWDDDPVLRCLQRDLGFSRGKLRTRLNEARRGNRD